MRGLQKLGGPGRMNGRMPRPVPGGEAAGSGTWDGSAQEAETRWKILIKSLWELLIADPGRKDSAVLRGAC